jgi:hypothetical protein
LRRIVVIVALAGFAVWPVALHAERITRGPLIQVTDVVATPDTIHVVHSVRRTNTLLPPALPRLELQFPPGARVHRAGVPRCGLAELQAKGPTACPRGGRVGSGSIVGRTDLYPEGVDSRVTIFNGEVLNSRRTLLMFVRPKLGPSFVAVARLLGGREVGIRIDLVFPPFKHFESEPDVSLSDFFFRFERAFVRASCPATYRVTSHFFDGALTSSDRARCE